jgi:cytochrome c553
VGVRGYDEESDFELQVAYQEVEAENFSQCFRSEFPASSAIVKADWRRAEFGIRLASYDTSAEGLRRHLGGNRDWGDGDSERDPGPDAIHTMRLPNGNVYRLAGLHIMTKELRHWTWTTLWWSDTPDTDFGEDRPDSIRALPGAWKNYKMCTASNYRELDPLPTGGYDQDAPSLAAALATVNQAPGSASWCSNPYMEVGPGNAVTNCIGCHQHGGTDASVPEIVSGTSAFPHHGTTKLRNNFPADYSWTLNQGDRLVDRIEDILDR